MHAGTRDTCNEVNAHALTSFNHCKTMVDPYPSSTHATPVRVAPIFWFTIPIRTYRRQTSKGIEGASPSANITPGYNRHGTQKLP